MSGASLATARSLLPLPCGDRALDRWALDRISVDCLAETGQPPGPLGKALLLALLVALTLAAMQAPAAGADPWLRPGSRSGAPTRPIGGGPRGAHAVRLGGTARAIARTAKPGRKAA